MGGRATSRVQAPGVRSHAGALRNHPPQRSRASGSRQRHTPSQGGPMSARQVGLMGLRLPFVAVWIGLLAPVPDVQAHESRPAYLEVRETTAGRYDVLWRTPVLSGMRLPVVLKFPDDVRNVTEPVLREL